MHNNMLDAAEIITATAKNIKQHWQHLTAIELTMAESRPKMAPSIQHSPMQFIHPSTKLTSGFVKEIGENEVKKLDKKNKKV